MTKIATATAVMQLVEAGDIGLDAPAREHLPDLDDLDPRITTRQLLNHSSGIANPAPLKLDPSRAETGPRPAERWSRLLSRYGKPKFEPGDHSAYTNIGYLVLGELIAAASGLPYKRLRGRAGAAAAGGDLDRLHPRRLGEIRDPATGYHPRRDPLLPVFRMLLPRWVIGPPVGRWRSFAPFLLDGSAYGGLIGPVADAALLAAAHLGGGEVDGRRILSPESVAEMQRIETPAGSSTSASAGSGPIATASGAADSSSTSGRGGLRNRDAALPRPRGRAGDDGQRLLEQVRLRGAARAART